MKVVCIENVFNGILNENFEIGQIYELEDEEEYMDSSGEMIFYKIKGEYLPKQKFISLEEHRERQLKLILPL